jgi:hypothetical protein
MRVEKFTEEERAALSAVRFAIASDRIGAIEEFLRLTLATIGHIALERLGRERARALLATTLAAVEEQ